MQVFCPCGAIENILLAAGDKRGFLCNACGGLFDAYPDGRIVRSPLRKALVIKTGSRPDISGGHGTLVDKK